MNDPQHESTLREHVGVLRRHKLLIVFVMVLVIATALAMTVAGGARYKAVSDVLLTRQDVASQITDLATPTSAGDFARIASTQAGVAASPSVARKALGLAGVRDLTPREFLMTSSVDVDPATDILQFSVESPRPETAVKLADAYSSAYVAYRRSLDTAPIRDARSQARARIKILEKSGDQESRLYAALLEKDEQLSTAEALQGANATIIRTAGPAVQIAPRIRRNAALGALVGGALGVALAFLTEALNTRVRSPDEVRDALDLPLLGFIPPPSRDLRGGLLMLQSPNSASAEAYRVLRTNISFANLEQHASVVLITSAVPTEGKSTTISNLAVTYARAGARVILLDLDLRRPAVASLFQLPPHAGVTDVALGASSLTEALQCIELDTSNNGAARPFADRESGSLHVLTGGWVPPDVGEFVAGRSLAGIISQLRQRVDMVFIDAPPLLNVGDALAVSESLDALLVVARIDKLRRNVVRKLGDVLAAAPVPKLGLIATGSTEVGLGYGYGYGYGYGSPMDTQGEGAKVSLAP